MNTILPTLQLRDVHLPEPISWWPPAPGWWLLMLVASFITVIIWKVYQWYKIKRLRRLALRELDKFEASYRQHQDSTRLAAELSILLRRFALLIAKRSSSTTEQHSSPCVRKWLFFDSHGRRYEIDGNPCLEVAGLTGEAWLGFLDKDLADPLFSQGPGRVLLTLPFQKNVIKNSQALEMTALLQLCRTWVKTTVIAP